MAIVADPDFGDKLFELAGQMPVWIADTPTNRASVERFWSEFERKFVVTVFSIRGTDAMEWLLSILPQVDLHHGSYSQSPAYDSVEVHGTGLTEELRMAFGDYGFHTFSEFPDRFRASRRIASRL